MNIPENILINYITKIQTSYGNNPYHNKLHAFDVCQVINKYLRNFAISL